MLCTHSIQLVGADLVMNILFGQYRPMPLGRAPQAARLQQAGPQEKRMTMSEFEQLVAQAVESAEIAKLAELAHDLQVLHVQGLFRKDGDYRTSIENNLRQRLRNPQVFDADISAQELDRLEVRVIGKTKELLENGGLDTKAALSYVESCGYEVPDYFSNMLREVHEAASRRKRP